MAAPGSAACAVRTSLAGAARRAALAGLLALAARCGGGGELDAAAALPAAPADLPGPGASSATLAPAPGSSAAPPGSSSSSSLPPALRPPPAVDAASPTHLEVRADPPVGVGEEAYLCFFLDGAALAGRYLRSLHWNPPAGPVVIHHATIFAGSGSGPLGEVSCETPLDTAAVLHIYTPGAVPVALPDGVALQIAPGTTRMALQMHLLRLGEGEADVTSIDLDLATDTPAHIAGWVDDRAPVPTLAPHAELASTGVCRFASAVHVVSTWPHMHRAGKSFYGTVVRASGARQSLIELPVWSFSHQPMYARDVALEPGDGVETLCVWENITDQPIAPGAYSHDEMCNQGLYVWPLEAARCAP